MSTTHEVKLSPRLLELIQQAREDAEALLAHRTDREQAVTVLKNDLDKTEQEFMSVRYSRGCATCKNSDWVSSIWDSRWYTFHVATCKARVALSRGVVDDSGIAPAGFVPAVLCSVHELVE